MGESWKFQAHACLHWSGGAAVAGPALEKPFWVARWSTGATIGSAGLGPSGPRILVNRRGTDPGSMKATQQQGRACPLLLPHEALPYLVLQHVRPSDPTTHTD